MGEISLMYIATPQPSTATLLPGQKSLWHFKWCYTNSFKAQDGAMQVSIAQQPQPARVGADVAADVARALRAQVQRHDEAALPDVVVQSLQHAARLAYEGTWCEEYVAT